MAFISTLQSCSRVPNTGTGTRTGTHVWVQWNGHGYEHGYQAMLKHGYWYGCHNGYSGTGTGTMKWVWVRVGLPSHVETRVQVWVRVPKWYSGTGTNFATWVRVRIWVLHLWHWSCRFGLRRDLAVIRL